MATKRRTRKDDAGAPLPKTARVPPLRLRPDFGPPRDEGRDGVAQVELEAEKVPELPAAGNQVVPSAQQPVEGTTYQITCRRHGNLIAWAWTPGDPRQQADLVNLYKLIAPHARRRNGLRFGMSGGCQLEFSDKAIP